MKGSSKNKEVKEKAVRKKKAVKNTQMKSRKVKQLKNIKEKVSQNNQKATKKRPPLMQSKAENGFNRRVTVMNFKRGKEFKC